MQDSRNDNVVLNQSIDDQELVQKISQHIEDSNNHLNNWIKESQDSYDFYSGKQWTDEDIGMLKEQDRVAVVFNRVARVVNAVAGFELQNRQEVRYYPREQGDAIYNDILTGAAEWARDNCDAEDEESEAFIDSLITGMGWTETRIDYDLSPDGQIVIDRVDPLEMRFDPSSKKRNIDDAKWCARIKRFTKDEFEEYWPDVDIQYISTRLDVYENVDQPHNADDAWEYGSRAEQPYYKKSKPYAVVQYQWWEREPYYRVLSPNNNVVSLDISKFNKIKDNPEMMVSLGIDPYNFKYVKQHRRIYKQAFTIGGILLEKGKTPCNHFTFKCVTGMRDRNTNYWHGIVHLMLDPQRWANKWLSQIQHILNTNSKNSIGYETGAIANPRHFEEEWARPGSTIEFNPGGLQKILQFDGARYPDGLDRLLQYALSSINDVVGISDEIMGTTGRFQAGYLEVERKRSTVMVLSIFFDSLRRYRKEQGRVLAEMIQKYISDGRLIRIVGENGRKYVPLMRENLNFEYDVIIDEAPSSTNAKERTFSVLSQIMPQLLQAGIPIPPELLEYTPLPQTLIDKWKQYINSAAEDPSKDQIKAMQMMKAQLDIEKQQIENQKMTAEISETMTQSTLNQAKAAKEEAVAKDEAAQAAQKMGLTRAVENQKMEHKDAQMIRDEARKDMSFALEQRRRSIESGNTRISER